MSSWLNLHATTWCFAGAVQGKMNTASHQLSSQMETEADGVSKQCRQRPAAHRSQQSVERQEKDVARLRKMGNASTRNAYSSSQQKVSSHSHGISNIEGLIVSTTPEPKVKQKRIREPDCHKKGGWVAIGTFVVTHPSEKVPILCNTRYLAHVHACFCAVIFRRHRVMFFPFIEWWDLRAALMRRTTLG